MSQKKKKTNRRTITGKSILSMILLGLFMIIASSLAAGIQIYQQEIREFREYAVSYSGFISDNISGESIPKYLETGEKDDNYTNILWALATANRSGMFHSIYVYVPQETGVIYIADSYFPDDDSLSAEEFLQTLQDHEAEFLEFREYYPGEEKQVKLLVNNLAEDAVYTHRRPDDNMLVSTALCPLFYENNGKMEVAIIGTDIAMNRIWHTILRMSANIAGAIALIIAIAVVVYYFLISRSMIQPLVRLQSATKDLVDNLDSDEPFHVDVHTNDEIESLAESFEEMDINLKHYIKENTAITAEKERLSTELDLARRIQAAMLPRKFPEYPEYPEVELFATMDPAKEVGGDFYDFFPIDETHLGLVMADVSGKGIPAALFMMMAKIMLQNLARTGLSPKDVLERVNNQICETNPEEMFVTVWFGVLDLTNGLVRAVNAGHEYPFLKKPDGSFELVKDRHGLVVGGMSGVPYREYELLLEPGSKLFLYTDGLPEATNAENELFGTDRSLAALNEVADKSPKEILHHVKEAADRFVGDAPQFDDLTMMCVVFHEPKISGEESGEPEENL